MNFEKSRTKLYRPRRVVSLQFILSSATAALIAASLISFGWLAERKARETLAVEMETRLIIEARNVASLSVDALLSDFPELTLCPLVKEVQEDRPDLAFVVVLDHDNMVQGHLDLTTLGGRFELLDKLKVQPSTMGLFRGERILSDGEVLVASVPAKLASGRVVGKAVVGLNQSYIDTIVASPRNSFLILTAGLLVIGVALSLTLMGILLRPITALRQGLERIGQGNLDTPIILKDKTDLGLLAETVNGMAIKLKESQIKMLENERLGHEMDLAGRIQQSLLPEGSLTTAGYLCAGAYYSAAEVGGDYYDYFDLPDGRTGVVIADVSGKGLGGCMVTSMLAVLLRSLREHYESPSDLLVALEKSMASSLRPGTFITVFYGILDPVTDTLTFASAAHSPLLIYRAESKQVDSIRTKGVPVGALKGGALERSLEDIDLKLEPGDLVLQYTDGLSEAWNEERKEQFGFQRIESTVLDLAAAGHQALMDSLYTQAQSWSSPDPLGDDLTMVVIASTGTRALGVSLPSSEMVTILQSIQSRADLEAWLTGSPHRVLTAESSEMATIRPWMESIIDLSGLLEEEKILIESSLFEMCTNIFEHGYENHTDQCIDLWWVPNAFFDSRQQGVGLGSEPFTDGCRDRKKVGHFLILDKAPPFNPGSWNPPDLNDSEVRRRGRGLGLQIINSVMKKVDYLAGTPAGNITVMRFDSVTHPTVKETENV